MAVPPFHLAFPVHSIEAARDFYIKSADFERASVGRWQSQAACMHDIDRRALPPLCSKLGCTEGRSAERWVDFNLYGHQIVAHLVDGYSAASSHNAGGWVMQGRVQGRAGTA